MTDQSRGIARIAISETAEGGHYSRSILALGADGSLWLMDASIPSELSAWRRVPPLPTVAVGDDIPF